MNRPIMPAWCWQLLTRLPSWLRPAPPDPWRLLGDCDTCGTDFEVTADRGALIVVDEAWHVIAACPRCGDPTTTAPLTAHDALLLRDCAGVVDGQALLDSFAAQLATDAGRVFLP